MRKIAPILVTCLAVAVFLGVGFGGFPFKGSPNDPPSAPAELAAARDQTAISQSQLTAARAELAAAQADLAVTSDNLSAAQAELAATQLELADARADMTAAGDELQSTRIEITGIRENLAQVTAELASAKLTLSTGIILRNPTYQEALLFLSDDGTNLNQYVPSTYTCRDFSADVIKNAEAKGLRAAYVSIEMVKGSHAVIAFDTTDRGLIYVEPQNDKQVLLTVGQSYLKVNGYKAQSGVDDTMVHVAVIW